MQLRINLDRETTVRLTEEAVRNRRPIPWHAEVLLRQSLGLPCPGPTRDRVEKRPKEARHA